MTDTKAIMRQIKRDYPATYGDVYAGIAYALQASEIAYPLPKVEAEQMALEFSQASSEARQK